MNNDEYTALYLDFGERISAKAKLRTEDGIERWTVCSHEAIETFAQCIGDHFGDKEDK